MEGSAPSPCSVLRRLIPAVPVVLRVVIGAVLALDGWQKLTQMGPATSGESMLGGLGLPTPVALGWAVSLIELVGGIALIVGLGTRIAALLLGVVLAVTVLGPGRPADVSGSGTHDRRTTTTGRR